MLQGLLKNLIILLLIGGILYGVTQVSPFIKEQTNKHASGVLGATSKTVPLPDSLKKDTSEQLEKVKDSALQVNVQDVVNAFSHLSKIQKDTQNVIHTTTDLVNTLLK